MIDLKLRRRTCKSCNGGWMGNLDTGLRDIVAPVIEHGAKSLHLDQSAQRILSMWATKQALLTQVYYADQGEATGYGFVPGDNLEGLYEAGRDGGWAHHDPPLGTQVWLSAIAWDRDAVDRMDLNFNVSRSIARPDGFGCYFATVIFGPLVFQVFGRDSHFPKGSDVPLTGDPIHPPFELTGVLIPIWKARQDEISRAWPTTASRTHPSHRRRAHRHRAMWNRDYAARRTLWTM
jgi:hypothetical protein